MASRVLSFYFDYLSPYAYLAWTRIGPLAARRGLRLEPRPVLFAGLLKHWAHRGPAEIPPKRTFIFKDALRTAALWGVPMACPRMHPFNPLPALRLSLAEVAGPDRTRVIEAIFRAGWGEGADLGDEGDLG
ncbi:MAG: DsbA family protein, partial [Candidatus Methylomirabilis sp.]|nr:DsbA family protein [Deltaproteobacteria bacterium]